MLTSEGFVCYGVTPLCGSNVIGLSDVLCLLPRFAVGNNPTKPVVRLNQTNTALVNWSEPPAAGTTDYLFLPLGTNRLQSLPFSAFAASDDTGGALTCYVVGALAGSTLVGYSDAVCALPDLSFGLTVPTATPIGPATATQTAVTNLSPTPIPTASSTPSPAATRTPTPTITPTLTSTITLTPTITPTIAPCSGVVGNLVQDCSFETPLIPPGSFFFLGPGDTGVTGWVVDTTPNGGVDLTRGDFVGTFPVQDGSQSLDLNHDIAGGIQQTIPTTAGQSYLLRFGLSGYPAAAAPCSAADPKVVLVTAASSSQSFSFTPNVGASPPGNQAFALKTLSFVGDSSGSGTTTTLNFTSQTAGCAGPLIDNVSVVRGIP